MKAKMIPVESFYEGGDTEAKATERYMRGGFGNLKTKVSYKRYSEYVEWLRNRNKVPDEHHTKAVASPKLTNQTTIPSDDGELDKILAICALWGTSHLGTPEQEHYVADFKHSLSFDEAKAALNAYILAEALKIVGEDDVPYGNEVYPAKPGAVERNKLRAEIRQALTAHFGGQK